MVFQDPKLGRDPKVAMGYFTKKKGLGSKWVEDILVLNALVFEIPGKNKYPPLVPSNFTNFY